MKLSTDQAIGLAVSALIIFVVYKIRKWSNYFKDRNIPFIPGVWPFGSSIRAALFSEHFAIAWVKMYQKLAPHKVGGFYAYGKPILMVRDPDFIHRIYATDFSHFVDRGFVVDEKKDPLDAHLFFLNGEKWKYMRNKLSPIFTSGKLKWMFEQMKDSSDKFVKFFDASTPKDEETDLRESFARYTTDVISSCAFGIESNAMGDPDNQLREMGRNFFDPSSGVQLKFVLRFAAPALLAMLKIRTVSEDITKFFIKIVKQAFEYRLKTNYERKDFVQLLLELRQKGHVELDDKYYNMQDSHSLTNGSTPNGVNSVSNKQKAVIELDDPILTAQLFVFFIGGFESSSSTLYYITYLLSLNPNAQDKARDEARRVIKKYGEFTYDSLKDLKYIDNCVCETLRILPVFPNSFRICTKDYTFPDGTKIEKGQSVLLPTYALHHDSRYFPEPEKFIPERFDGTIVKGTYAPFGDGPRICIGKRFAEVEIKLTLAKLLLKYYFRPPQSEVDLKDWNVRSLVAIPKKPLLVKIERIECS